MYAKKIKKKKKKGSEIIPRQSKNIFYCFLLAGLHSKWSVVNFTTDLTSKRKKRDRKTWKYAVSGQMER